MTANQLVTFRAAVKARREWIVGGGNDELMALDSAYGDVVRAFRVQNSGRGQNQLHAAIVRWSEQP